jgi:hypothetical protein
MFDGFIVRRLVIALAVVLAVFATFLDAAGFLAVLAKVFLAFFATFLGAVGFLAVSTKVF